MTEVSEGDLVEAAKTRGGSSTRFQGIVSVNLNSSQKVMTPIIRAQGYSPSIKSLVEQGFILRIVTPAHSRDQLPTAPGVYRDVYGDTWICRPGEWKLAASGGNYLPASKISADHLPFTRLEPVVDTAKSVIQSIQVRFDATGAPLERLLLHVANEFNVVPTTSANPAHESSPPSEETSERLVLDDEPQQQDTYTDREWALLKNNNWNSHTFAPSISGVGCGVVVALADGTGDQCGFPASSPVHVFDDDDTDDEEFCPVCLAGTTSDIHLTSKCGEGEA